MRRRWWIDILLVLALVAIVAISFLLGRQAGDGEFEGTDAAVTQVIEDEGHRPWFTPLFEPGSAELESGLFALQAALGAGVLGYCIGRLHGRRKREPGTPQEAAGGPGDGAMATGPGVADTDRA